MDKNVPMSESWIAALVMTAILTLGGFISFIADVSLWSLLAFAGYTTLLVSMIMRKRGVAAFVGVGILTLVATISFFLGFPAHLYHNIEGKLNFLAVIPALINVLTYVLLLFVVDSSFTKFLPIDRKLFKKLWFSPAVCVVVSIVVAFIVYLLSNIIGLGGYWFGYISYFGGVIVIIGQIFSILYFLAVGFWVAYPAGTGKLDAIKAKHAEKEPKAEKRHNDYEGNGYIGMVKHCLLLAFTFGIWYYIWIYKVTKFLNQVEGEKYRDPVKTILLCLFIPLYVVFWTYKSAERVDELAGLCRVRSNITVISTVFAMVYILSAVIIQDKINEIAESI